MGECEKSVSAASAFPDIIRFSAFSIRKIALLLHIMQK